MLSTGSLFPQLKSSNNKQILSLFCFHGSDIITWPAGLTRFLGDKNRWAPESLQVVNIASLVRKDYQPCRLAYTLSSETSRVIWASNCSTIWLSPQVGQIVILIVRELSVPYRSYCFTPVYMMQLHSVSFISEGISRLKVLNYPW